MAYYGGVKSDRPWPKVNMPIVALNGVMVLICLTMAYLLLNSQDEKPAAAPAAAQDNGAVFKDVLVATQDINPGEALHPSMFISESRPVNGIEDYVVSDVSIVNENFAGSMILEGAPLLRPYVNATGDFSNIITRKIPKGYRAVAIPVTNLSGVEGWVLPGSRVDIVWATEHRGKPLVSIIVENVLVISAGQNIANVKAEDVRDTNSVVNSVTVVVPLKDAQKIELAKNSAGKISLGLRGDDDTEPVGSQITSLDGLIQARDLRLIDEVQGKVTIGKNDYLMKGGELVEARKVAAEEEQAAAAGKAE